MHFYSVKQSKIDPNMVSHGSSPRQEPQKLMAYVNVLSDIIIARGFQKSENWKMQEEGNRMSEENFIQFG